MEYKIIFENEKVCVARVKLMAGEEVGLHRDEYPAVVIALQGGVITRLEQNGTITDVIFPTHVPIYRPTDPAGELHKSVNQSDLPIELIITQIKN